MWIWAMALQKLPGEANVVIVLSLCQRRLPVLPSYAWSTAGVPRPVAVAGAPVASVNTTPLTMIGVDGDERSCDTHPGSSVGAPPPSFSFSATTAPFETGPLVAGMPLVRRPATGNRIHDVFDCCHAASASPATDAPAPTNGFDA